MTSYIILVVIIVLKRILPSVETNKLYLSLDPVVPYIPLGTSIDLLLVPTSLPHHSPTFHLPYGAGTAGERMVSGGEGVGMGRVGMRMWGASRRRDTRRSEWEGWKACLIHVTFTPHAFHLSNSWSTAYDSLLTSLPSRHVRPFRLRSSTRPTGVSRALRASRTGSLHSAEWNGESVTAPWETNRRDREWHERLMPVLGSLTSTSLPFRPLHLRFRPGSGPVAEGRG